MATSSSALILLLAVSFAAGASTTSFSITNHFTVWPVARPVGGGRKLNSGEMWNLDIPAGTRTATIWGRTALAFPTSAGCSFNGNSGRCATADCAGALFCTLSGQPPLTLAEFTLGGEFDSYDISVIDGFNIGVTPRNRGKDRGLVLEKTQGPKRKKIRSGSGRVISHRENIQPRSMMGGTQRVDVDDDVANLPCARTQGARHRFAVRVPGRHGHRGSVTKEVALQGLPGGVRVCAGWASPARVRRRRIR
nr:thaumatin-like protein [Lolium perenne]